MEFKVFGKRVYISRVALCCMVLAAALMLGTLGFILSSNYGGIVFLAETSDIIQEINSDDPGTSEKTAGSGNKGKAEEEKNGVPDYGTEGDDRVETIKVYVVGCVKNPGIVTLKKGQLIDDAIKAAGGPTEDADLENINLVYELKENVMLKIKSKKESMQESVPSSQGSSPGASPAGSGVAIIRDSGGALAGEHVTGDIAGKKININTASIDELDTLPGIGKETARDIIAYREANGKFRTIEDIMKVPGIKENKFSKIKDLICVE